MERSPALDRRRFLVVLAAGLGAAAVGRGASHLGQLPAVGTTASRPAAAAKPAVATPEPAPLPPGLVPVDPPFGEVSMLPGEGTALALTIDDGVSSEVVAAYAQLATDSGIRLTFFPNGRYSSWTDNLPALRPLVDSGQVALGNHTWSHPDVTTLSDADVVEEISRNREWIWQTFGVRDTPFFRPPFGAHDDRTDRIAADQGHPTIAMWDGTLGDDRIITGDQIVDNARQWFSAQSITIGHANHPAVTSVYGQLLDLLSERGLTTVTLADVWATPAQRVRGLHTTATAPTD
jgi:peptidoglycan/xylan/chitin deacetylase (PgdA/CDA1 family)